MCATRVNKREEKKNNKKVQRGGPNFPKAHYLFHREKKNQTQTQTQMHNPTLTWKLRHAAQAVEARGGSAVHLALTLIAPCEWANMLLFEF